MHLKMRTKIFIFAVALWTFALGLIFSFRGVFKIVDVGSILVNGAFSFKSALEAVGWMMAGLLLLASTIILAEIGQKKTLKKEEQPSDNQ